MKAIYFLFLVTILSSCTKDQCSTTPVVETEPIATLKYSLNGKDYVYQGNSFDPESKPGIRIALEVLSNPTLYHGYYLSATLSEKIGIRFKIGSSTDNLSIGSYNWASTREDMFQLSDETSSLALRKPDSQAQINITKIEKGFANGTFTARVARTNSSPSLEVLNGEFFNVKIYK